MFRLKQLPLFAFWMVMVFALESAATQGTISVQNPSIQPAKTANMVVSKAHFKSYREWKSEQIQDVQGKISTIKVQLEAKKQTRSVAQGVDPNLAMNKRGTEAGELSIEKLEKQLQEEQYDLDVAKDLTVTDYFVGYLTKVDNKKAAFHEVAGKLSPEEVAELMTAYANSVFGAHTTDLPASASNLPKDNIK